MNIFGTDYDGTIINVEPQKAEAFASVVSKRWQVNKEEAANLWIEAGGTSRRYKFDFIFEKQFRTELSNEAYKSIEQEFSILLRTELYPRLKLEPDALELLKYIRSHFDYSFVSSGVPMEEIKYLVNLNGVSEYFDIVLGTDDKYRSKHDHFAEIIATQKPNRVIYLADGLEDMKVAKEYGVISIGIPTNHSPEEMLNVGATYICYLKDSISILEHIKEQ